LALPCPRPDRDALLKSIHDLVEKAGVVKDGWNGYNVIHDNASRVAALDIGFAPRSVLLRKSCASGLDYQNLQLCGAALCIC
jgi:hypothetical protein